MRNLGRQTAWALASAASLMMAACSSGTDPNAGTYVLTVNSSNPATGVPIGVTTAGSNSTTSATTSFSQNYKAGASFTLTAPATSGLNRFSSWTGCASTTTVLCAVTLSADTTVTANYVTPAISTPTVTVTCSPSSILITQGVSVSVAVAGPAGGATPTGSITLSSGSYSSAVTTLNSGGARIDIPAGALGGGSDTLTAVFTPDAASAPIYTSASGTGSVTVTVPAKTTPTVTVTPSSLSVSTGQPMVVAVAVSGGNSNMTPTGTVTLVSGSYRSAATALSGGSAAIYVAAGTLAAGSETLEATYAPDAASASTYNAASGISSAVTVMGPTSITVDASSKGIAVTDQILGMNMAYWYDPSSAAILPAFKTAGIKAIRWPGGTAANEYHWATNTLCGGGQTLPSDDFDTFIAEVVQPGNFDLALSANYGTNAACNGPGDPAEAAAWVQNAMTNGNHVSHVTVGNEDWGNWEPDMHTSQHDPATYAQAVASGYYPQIKAANPNVLVGVNVIPGNTPAWDPIVLSQAKYDFVEFHFYAQTPGEENDTSLVQQGAQQFTQNIDAVKADLKTAGAPDTPIYVGEIGSVYDDPGKQSSSITQALFAGQALGEMMNDGVSRATWWLGFGGCNSDPTVQNFSSALYGWQNFGGYMVFSDGLPEYGCTGATIPAVPAGTLLPTARAFQLFSEVAVQGESVLTPTVAGDATDVRVYAATHSGGHGAGGVQPERDGERGGGDYACAAERGFECDRGYL